MKLDGSLLQYEISSDKSKTQTAVERLLSAVSTSWAILPEVSLTGFDFTQNDINDAGEMEFFRSMAVTLKKYITFGSVQNQRNSLFTLCPSGTVIAEYHKRHLFPLSWEKTNLEAGGAASVFEIEGVRVFPSICFDLRFPYQFFPASHQADVIINIANWPSTRHEQYSVLLRGRSIENQVYSLGVNRIGRDKHSRYLGGSLAVSFDGTIMQQEGENEAVIDFSIDTDEMNYYRNRYPFIRSRIE